jgi:hypothetical protein
MLMLALVAGSLSFLIGLGFILVLFALSPEPELRLFEINIALGSTIVLVTLGGFTVWQAASSLGGTASVAMRPWLPWPLLLAFPLLVGLGQLLVNSPSAAPWVFPFVNVGIVSIPSLAAAMTVARSYMLANPFSWPLSWREWTSGISYGAIGAIGIAGAINSIYFAVAAIYLISAYGTGDVTDLEYSLTTLPQGWGIFFDVSVLSIVAPLNEEFWKGALVAFFFFRKGGAARCFVWGVLAGAGFNLMETFQNSLAVVNPEVLADQTIGSQWWLFALARAGAGTMHACATGFSALGIYGLLRHRWDFAPAYLLGVLFHASWNFLVYVNEGDVFFSRSGPDSDLLDVLSVVGIVVLFSSTVVLLWEMPRRLRDEAPAAIYQVLGMMPASSEQDRLWIQHPFAIHQERIRPRDSTGPRYTT